MDMIATTLDIALFLSRGGDSVYGSKAASNEYSENRQYDASKALAPRSRKFLKLVAFRDTLQNKELDAARLPETVRSAWQGWETMMRRIRGAIGMGLTWAAALAIVGMVPRWVYGFNTDVPIPLVSGVFGFFAGVTISILLLLAERRRSFDEMSLPRFAGWGAVGGLVLSALWTRTVSLGWGDVLAIAPAFALASAACAAGSLALARRADRRELPDARRNNVKAKLSDH
jgi:hypothetical protein